MHLFQNVKVLKEISQASPFRAIAHRKKNQALNEEDEEDEQEQDLLEFEKFQEIQLHYRYLLNQINAKERIIQLVQYNAKIYLSEGIQYVEYSVVVPLKMINEMITIYQQAINAAEKMGQIVRFLLAFTHTDKANRIKKAIELVKVQNVWGGVFVGVDICGNEHKNTLLLSTMIS